MNLRNKRKELQGVNGAVGLIAGIAGFVGNFYTAQTAIVLMLGIWIIGSTLVILFTDPD